MAFTQITTSNLDNTITTKLAAAEAANAAVANIVSLAISSVQIADSSYNVLDDTAANTGGGYLVINGTGFTNQCVVIVGTTNATSTTFANTKQLRAQVPGLAAATYPLYVVDSVTGATAIKVNGLTYSSFPAWSTGSTLSNQAANTSFSVNLSANSDSAITYSNTTALPAGTTLAANGLFSGTVTIGAETTYSFDVRATDAESQDTTRTFSLTITITPAGGSLWGWGQMRYNGHNDSIYRSSPTQIGSGTDWKLLYGASGSIHVIKGNGTLWGWGQGSSGIIGTNDTIYRSSPTQVGTNTNWAMIGGDYWTTTAIKTDGTLWSWGAGIASGRNNTIDQSSPTQVGSETNWSAVFYGKGFSNSIQSSMATKTNGTLWTWGLNSSGQLGQGDVISRSSPVQVGSGTDWPLTQNKLTGTSTGIFAIKTNGTLWMWGGVANQSNVAYRSSPTQVGSETNWSTISGGWYTVGATKTDGTLWVWGWNGSGIIGNNSTTNQISPIQVGSSTNWSNVRLGMQNIMATKTDGTLWTWGNNYHGSLGHNNIIYRSSPVQVGVSTSWRTEYGAISMGFAGFATLNT